MNLIKVVLMAFIKTNISEMLLKSLIMCVKQASDRLETCLEQKKYKIKVDAKFRHRK